MVNDDGPCIVEVTNIIPVENGVGVNLERKMFGPFPDFDKACWFKEGKKEDYHVILIHRLHPRE